jgi:hypothetical protein
MRTLIVRNGLIFYNLSANLPLACMHCWSYSVYQQLAAASSSLAMKLLGHSKMAFKLFWVRASPARTSLLLRREIRLLVLD